MSTDNATVNATNSYVRIPWGTELFFANIITSGSHFPNAAQTHAYKSDYYRGVPSAIFFKDFSIQPNTTMEFIYTLKINDWTEQCPTGDTWHEAPYQIWKTSNDDVFIDSFQSLMHAGSKQEARIFNPSKGTFGDMPLEYNVGTFLITAALLSNQYGAFPNITEMYRNNTEHVTMSIFNGSGIGEVTNATMSLGGRSVRNSSSIYPYEFDITRRSMVKSG